MIREFRLDLIVTVLLQTQPSPRFDIDGFGDHAKETRKCGTKV